MGYLEKCKCNYNAKFTVIVKKTLKMNLDLINDIINFAVSHFYFLIASAGAVRWRDNRCPFPDSLHREFLLILGNFLC
jgi:hypothetical protein